MVAMPVSQKDMGEFDTMLVKSVLDQICPLPVALRGVDDEPFTAGPDDVRICSLQGKLIMLSAMSFFFQGLYHT
jgi:hypothetical protein